MKTSQVLCVQMLSRSCVIKTSVFTVESHRFVVNLQYICMKTVFGTFCKISYKIYSTVFFSRRNTAKVLCSPYKNVFDILNI